VCRRLAFVGKDLGFAVVRSDALSSCPESVVSILGEGRWAVLGEGRT